jgi:DNA-binding transcriptional LysR family regulator
MEVVLPLGHPLLGRKQIRLAELAKERFVLGSRAGSPFQYDWLLKLCHEAGFQPEIAQEVEHGQTAVELVAAGFGVALFPSTMQNRAHDDVVFRALKGAPAYRHSVAWRRGDESPTIGAFVSLLREELDLKAPATPAKEKLRKPAKGLSG